MQRNDLSIYEHYAQHWWDGSKRFQRILANQIQPRLRYFDSIAPRWKDLDVLDLGCGGGFMSEALARRGARVVGVDPCLSLLDVAREHARSEGLSILYREGTGEAIPLEAHSVDRVVCVDVLEHVKDPVRVLTEVRRVLRPDGIFFFDTIDRNWFSRFVVVTMGEGVLRLLPRGTHDPSKFIRPEEMRAYLWMAGFTEIPVRFMGMGPVWFNRRFDLVIMLLPTTKVLYLGYAK